MDGFDYHSSAQSSQINGKIQLVSVQSYGIHPIEPICENKSKTVAR